jgi:subtilisin family serine protease
LIQHPQQQRNQNGRRFLLASLLVGIFGLCQVSAVAAAPNDPSFSLQWADSNTGQAVPVDEGNERFGPPKAGAPGADDGALRAWQVTTGSRSIVIGETDTGIDLEDQDLKANVWTNPGGIGQCSGGTHGYNVLNNECEALDTEPLHPETGELGGHGTHVAGIIGAVGNNSLGVAGLDWQTTILPVKWLQRANHEEGVWNLIAALRWLAKAAREGVNLRVVNDSPSFEGPLSAPRIQEEREAIEELGAENVLFVTAAGNGHEDNDATSGRYPCRLDLPNEICVTATDDEDKLASWANWGPNTVDLAAPGVSIYSTLRNERYGYISGGSMAAAQVSGAAALILSVAPSLSPQALKADLLGSVDRLPSLSEKVITGGRLNICRALPGCEPPTVAGVSPAAGPSGGGTSVTLTGSNLSGATSVRFGEASAAVTGSSSTSITATAPPGAGTVNVTVTNPGGTSPITAADQFTYTPETPPQPPLAPQKSPSSTTVLRSSTLAVRHGRATVRLRCVGTAACSGALTIALKRSVHERGKPRRTVLLTIGRARFSLGAGRSRSFAVTLTARGRALLRRAHGRLIARLTIRPSSTNPIRSTAKRVRLIATFARR